MVLLDEFGAPGLQKWPGRSCYSGFPVDRSYSRVAQSDLPTPAPGSLRISARPPLEGGRLGEGPGKVFIRFYIRKHSQNIAKINPNQSQNSIKIYGNPCKSGLAAHVIPASL